MDAQRSCVWLTDARVSNRKAVNIRFRWIYFDAAIRYVSCDINFKVAPPMGIHERARMLRLVMPILKHADKYGGPVL